MSLRARPCLTLLVLALATLAQYRPAWAGRFSLDWWSIPELWEQLRRDEARTVALDRAEGGAPARAAARATITRDVLDGRLTLPRAAARFRALNDSAGVPIRPFGDDYPGASKEERLCRQVIGWAEAAVTAPESPEAGRRARRRLEGELAALLERGHGVIALPD